jgi:hypothetical protein
VQNSDLKRLVAGLEIRLVDVKPKGIVLLESWVVADTFEEPIIDLLCEVKRDLSRH